MGTEEYLCKCNNCGNIMYDENPQVNATKISTKIIKVPIYPMEKINIDGETFWGCGNCQTDNYLMDLDRTITYHRPPTPYELKLGYGATHYKDFGPAQFIRKDGAIKKRLKCPIDGLIYTY